MKLWHFDMDDLNVQSIFSHRHWAQIGDSFQLSPRQLQIAKLITDCASTAEIAEQVGVGEETIRMHIKELHKKFSVHSRLAMVIRLVRFNRQLMIEEIREYFSARSLTDAAEKCAAIITGCDAVSSCGAHGEQIQPTKLAVEDGN